MIKEVAEAKLTCGEVHPGQDVYHAEGHLCWPLLSRKCPCLDLSNTPCEGCGSHLMDERFGHWHQDNCDCKGSGRIPDVTLEKVLDLLIPYSECGDRVVIVRAESGYLVFPKAGQGNTPLEAACRALMATVAGRNIFNSPVSETTSPPASEATPAD